MLLTQKQSEKINSIIDNFINGNLTDSKNTIRKLNRIEIVLLLDKFNTERFTNFVIRALAND